LAVGAAASSHDVGAVVVLVADLALGGDAGGPVDDERVADAALVDVALEHPVRRGERGRPAGRVVVVGVRAAEPVDHGQVLLEVVGVATEDLALVDRAVRRALARRAVVGAVEDDRVVELPGLLEVVDDAAHLGVGVLGEPGVDLGHAAEHRLLGVVEAVPRAHHVGRVERPVGHRVERRQLRALGQDPALDHPRQHPLAVGLVAVVERALVLGDVVLGAVVRGVVGAGAEPQVPGLVGLRLLGVADHAQRLVGEVLGQVVAVLGEGRLVDVVVVLGEAGIPVVRLAADEAVEAVVALAERPVLLGGTHRPLVDRDVVVLADPERRPAGVAQDVGHRRVLGRDVRVVAREAGRGLRDRREAVEVVVPPGQERRARRRAQRGGVPLRVGQPVGGEAVHRRHVDAAAVGGPRSLAGVVVQDDEDVGRAVGRAVGEERRPVRGRVAHVELDLPLELPRHRPSPLVLRPVRRTSVQSR
jgi:hypothetical protein